MKTFSGFLVPFKSCENNQVSGLTLLWLAAQTCRGTSRDRILQIGFQGSAPHFALVSCLGLLLSQHTADSCTGSCSPACSYCLPHCARDCIFFYCCRVHGTDPLPLRLRLHEMDFCCRWCCFLLPACRSSFPLLLSLPPLLYHHFSNTHD